MSNMKKNLRSNSYEVVILEESDCEKTSLRAERSNPGVRARIGVRDCFAPLAMTNSSVFTQSGSFSASRLFSCSKRSLQDDSEVTRQTNSPIGSEKRRGRQTAGLVFHMILIALLAAPIFSLAAKTSPENGFAGPDKRPAPKNWALLIGIDNYLDSSLPPLTGAAKNVTEIANLLEQKYGYQKEHLIVILNEQATGNNIEQAFGRVLGSVNSDDSFFAYFAGHLRGAAKGERFFVPHDGKIAEPWTLIAEYQLQKIFSGVPAASFFAVIEGCFERFARTKETYQSNIYLPESQRASQILMFCPSPKTPDANRNTFALSLITGLIGQAANAQGTVTASSLHEYLQSKLPAAVQLAGFAPRAGGDFTFVPKRADLDPALLQQIDRAQDPAERAAAIAQLTEAVMSEPPEQRKNPASQLTQVLRKITQNSREESQVKEQALRALGRLQARDAIPELISVLTSAPADSLSTNLLHHAALAALSEIGGNEIAPALRSALRDNDPVVRIAAVRALAKLQDTAARPEILNLIRTDNNPEVRLIALGSLAAFVAPGMSVAEDLLPLLQDREAGIRTEAANVLGKLGEGRATPALMALLKNDLEPAVRQSAAYALGRLFQSDQLGVERALAEALRKDTHSVVREAATFALGQCGSENAKRQLRNALNTNDDYVRRVAADVLGDLRDREAVPNLIKLLQHQNWELRRNAAIALGKIGEANASAPLLAAVKDENQYVRAAAKNALDQIQATEKGEAFLRGLKDPAAEVRAEAVKQLAETKNPRYLPHLIAALADANYRVRQTAISGLAGFDADTSWKSIAAALDDPYILKRQGAATALGLLAKPESVEALLQHRKDATIAVRVEVVKALGLIRSERAIEPLMNDAQRDRDVTVRQAAVTALGNYIEDPRVRKTLEALAQGDEDSSVRRVASETLKKSLYRSKG